MLVTLLSAEAGMAQSDVSKASAEVTSRRAGAQYAASARARAERLLTLKAIPRQEYERAIADDEQARAALEQATAELRRARSAAQQMGAAGARERRDRPSLPARGRGARALRAAGGRGGSGCPTGGRDRSSDALATDQGGRSAGGLFRRGGSLGFRVPAYLSERFTARIDAVGAGLDPGDAHARCQSDCREHERTPQALHARHGRGGGRHARHGHAAPR